MKPQEFKELLDKYSRGECSPDEKRLIDDWYDNISPSEGDLEIPELEVESKLWKTLKPPVPVHQAHFFNQSWFKVAATLTLLLLVSAAVYLAVSTDKNTSLTSAAVSDRSQKFSEQFINTSSKTRKVRMSDGSSITLQPHSKVIFPKTFSKEKREVILHGEAFFEVKRDTVRPFYVYSREVVTKVLGTSFTIKALDSDPEVTVRVKTGKVSVYTNDNEQTRQKKDAYILTPNQEVVINRREEKAVKQVVPEPEIVLEHPTIFAMHYNNTPVTEIIDAISKNYGIQINYDKSKLSGCVLTTNMSDEGMFERIHIICKAINATYTVNDAVINIESSGCE